jgi:hypothetical protein
MGYVASPLTLPKGTPDSSRKIEARIGCAPLSETLTLMTASRVIVHVTMTFWEKKEIRNRNDPEGKQYEQNKKANWYENRRK